MKKFILIVITLFYCTFSLNAQNDCWDIKDTIFGSTFVKLVFVDSLNGITVINNTDTRNPSFKVTNDGGNTWNYVFKDQDSLFVDTTNGSNKYKWIYQSPSFKDLSCLSQNLCFGVGLNSKTDTGMVWKSTDFGSNWRKIKTGFSDGFYEIKAINENLVYALAKRIIKSTDGGEHWIELNIPQPNEQYGNAELSAFTDGTIFLKCI